MEAVITGHAAKRYAARILGDTNGDASLLLKAFRELEASVLRAEYVGDASNGAVHWADPQNSRFVMVARKFLGRWRVLTVMV